MKKPPVYVFLMIAAALLFFQFAGTRPSPDRQERLRVVFYNVENLFDTLNDSLKNDDEFTPEGDKNWTYSRYQAKLSKIYKVLTAVGEWEPAALIGLCEVENYQTLRDLVNKTPLEKFDYEVVHKESPDRRGIDNALLYRKDLFRPIEYEPIAVGGAEPSEWASREILYVKGVVFQSDTLHVFVNHWPSRYGGQLVSEKKRILAATLVRIKTDSILRHNKRAKIIVMGDLNDNPDDKSVRILTSKEAGLINLMNEPFRAGEGTLTYTDSFLQWYLFDQFIVSPALVDGQGSLQAQNRRAYIFRPRWLLNEKGDRPYRTYQGPAYIGGFSDHLPVYFDLVKKE